MEDVVSELLSLGVGAKDSKVGYQKSLSNSFSAPTRLTSTWQDWVYVDAALSFHLKLKLIALADAIGWIALNQGVQCLWHCLIVCWEPDSEQFLELVVSIRRHLGEPLAVEKVEGSKVCLVFLWIVMDTVVKELRLPRES